MSTLSLMCGLDMVKEDKRNGRFLWSRELGHMENNEQGIYSQGGELQPNQQTVLSQVVSLNILPSRITELLWTIDYCYRLSSF